MPQIADALKEAERMVDIGAIGNGSQTMALLSIARDIREMLRMMQGEHDGFPDGVKTNSAKTPVQKGTGRGRQS